MNTTQEVSTENLYALAYSLYENGKYQEAAQCFRVLVETDKYNFNNWVGLGAAHQMLKEYNDALAAYAFAALLDERDPNIHLHAAECLFALEEKQQGLVALEAAEGYLSSDAKHDPVRLKITALREAYGK